MSSLAVVIPFYQREPHILSRTLASVIAQSDLDDVTIHVVDDQSPLDPTPEIEEARSLLGEERVVLHRKINGGPGSARNFALDHLQDVEIVAFLDSDDEWTPNHIANIRKAMSMGADFYFADHIRVGNPDTRFTETKFLDGPSSLKNGLCEFVGDLFSLLLHRSPVGTSTVAYRFSAFPSIRFHEEWRCGEDILFWMEIAERARKIYFSPTCDVNYGSGVNIFEGCRWGTTTDLIRHYHVASFHSIVARVFSLDEKQNAWNKRWLAHVDQAFMSSFLSAVRHNQPGCLAAFRTYVTDRPQAILRIIPAFWSLLRPI